MLLSVLTRKGKVPRHNFHPPRSRLAKRRQISVGGSLRARSPDPAQLSSLREPGTQDPTGPQAPQATQTARARSHRLCPTQTTVAMRSQRRAWGRGSPPHQGLGPASGRSWWGLWSPAGHTPSLFPGSPSSPANPRPGELEGPGEKARICLLPNSPPEDHHSGDPWLDAPPPVAHWQLLVWGGAHCSTDQWLNGPSNVRPLTAASLGRGPLCRPMAEHDL